MRSSPIPVPDVRDGPVGRQCGVVKVLALGFVEGRWVIDEIPGLRPADRKGHPKPLGLFLGSLRLRHFRQGHKRR
jgi:hypothetical protein